MKVGIVGSGISGLSAAYFLSGRHEVQVLEADRRIGGHTATVDVSGASGDFAVDTGFIVFNERTYPNFIRLMAELGVESRATSMSFSVSDPDGGFEYAGSGLNALFAQRSNLCRPAYWGMLRDILRFNRESVDDLDNGRISPGMSLGEYLERGAYGRLFRDRYLVPMGAAIWSAGTQRMESFPLQFFLRFFRNHGLLQVSDRPQWYTITGGSREYLAPLTRRFASNIHKGDAAIGVRRGAEGVDVRTASGQVYRFDHLVLAVHSDQALTLLEDADDAESEVLGAIPYQENDVVLHTDERLLPRRRLAWSSWNYRLGKGATDLPVLTYNMNMLQGLESEETFCVTLNSTESIAPDKLKARFSYSHPVFTLDGIRAQARIGSLNGQRRSWFCGAWCGNGFHEDGVSSALRVAKSLGVDW